MIFIGSLCCSPSSLFKVPYIAFLKAIQWPLTNRTCTAKEAAWLLRYSVWFNGGKQIKKNIYARPLIVVNVFDFPETICGKELGFIA